MLGSSTTAPPTGRLRVLYDVRPLQTASRLRGIGIVTRALLEALSKLGCPHELALLCWPGERPELDLAPGCAYRWVEVARPPVHRLGWLWDAWVLRRIAAGYDRAICLSPFDLQLGWAWHLSTAPGSVVMLYDLIPVLHADTIYHGKQRLLKPLFRHQAHRLRKAWRVLCISESTAELARAHLQLDDTVLRVTPLGVDGRFYRPTEAEVADFRAARGLEEPYLLYVGGPNPNKNLDRLFAALQLLTEPPLLVCVTRGLDPRRHGTLPVRVMEGVSDAELRLLYGGARLVVQPSLFEGFGLPVAEAMACGAPVACSQIAPLVEVAGGYARTFDPLDIHSMARTIEATMGDSQWLAWARAHGVERAATFSWERCARLALAAIEGG